MSEPGAAQLVVIVEDDPAIAEGLALNLKLQGYRTEVAGDGEAAAALIDSARPDLVLLDISLPKQSGIWVLETVRGGGNQVPVIVLSARQDEFDKVAALQLGADRHQGGQAGEADPPRVRVAELLLSQRQPRVLA